MFLYRIWSIDYDSPSTGNGGTIPALPSTCGEDICWNVSGDKKVKCSDDGTNWDMGDRDDDIPDDILNIRKLAAIGDSYSAGIGAGDRLGSIYDAFEAGIGKSSSWGVPCTMLNLIFLHKTLPVLATIKPIHIFSTRILELEIHLVATFSFFHALALS